MSMPTTYGEVLDAINQLPDDQQSQLIETVRNRLAMRRRERLLADVREAREESARGLTRPMTVDEIMREIEK